jgi:hypothetical protein
MKFTSFGIALMTLLAIFIGMAGTGRSQGTAFTYQGRLFVGTNAANGTYDVQFTLFAASQAGPPAAGPVTNSALWVTNGLFQATLDFGAAVFNGSNYWLELAVRTNGGNFFMTLAPRQNLTPAPYALYATAAGSVSANGIVGTIPLAQLPASVVTNTAGGTIPVSELPAASTSSGTSGGTISSNSYGFLNTQQFGGYATVPPVCYNTWDTWYGGYNSNGLTMDLQFLHQSAPILLNYNQQGFALAIDDGLFASRAGGILQINPTNFPWTANQLTFIAHTNGVKILCYMEPNGTGAGGRTSDGFPDSEGTNIEWDATQFANDGFDGLKLDPHGWSTEAEEILAVQRAEAAFRLAASNRSAIFLHDENFFASRDIPPYPDVSQVANAYPGTIVRMSSEFSDHGLTNYGWSFYLVNYIDNIINLQALNKAGQWIVPVETPTDDWTGNGDTPPVQRLIELSSAEFGGPVLFDQLNGVSAASLTMMTNTEILDVAYDPLWIIGQPVPGVGGSNTFEVFVKTLSDPFGGKELFLLNRNLTTAQTVAFNWPEIGYATSRQILVRDTQAQTNFGVYSNAFSLNLAPYQCYLLRFEPVDNPWLNYVVSSTASALPPAGLSLSNSISAITAGTNIAVTVTRNADGSQSVRLDGLSTTGLQLLLQTVATLTNNLVLPPAVTCPLVLANGASGLWNSNGVATWLRTSRPGSTNVTDHLLFVH